jgi:hypothetical protein
MYVVVVKQKVLKKALFVAHQGATKIGAVVGGPS